MKKLMIGLFAAATMLAAGAQQAEAQVRVHIPGTPVNVRVGDPDPYYRNDYRYNNNGYYYNRYNRGYWVDNNGRARYNNGYYTGWRGNTYYENGRAVRVRNGRNIIWIR